MGPWVCELRGSNFYAGCVGYEGLIIFYVGHNFYVGCVGQNFLRGSIFFVVGLKNIDWRFHNNILVVHYIHIGNMLNQHPISCNSSFT